MELEIRAFVNIRGEGRLSLPKCKPNTMGEFDKGILLLASDIGIGIYTNYYVGFLRILLI